MNPEFNVQSICLGYNRVIVGLRSGSIQEMPISDDDSAQVQSAAGANQDRGSRYR